MVLMAKFNQQYTLSKVSLNRNTHNTQLHTDQWMKVLGPEAHRSLMRFKFPKASGHNVSLRSHGSVFTNSRFTATLVK